MFCPKCNKIKMTPREEAEMKQCLRCALQKAILLEADMDVISLESFGRTEKEKINFLNDLKKDEDEVSKIIGKPISPEEAFRKKVNKDLNKDIFPGSTIKTIKVQAPGNEDVMLTLQLPVPYPIDEAWFDEIEKIMDSFLKGTFHLLTFAPVMGTPNEIYFNKKGTNKGDNGEY